MVLYYFIDSQKISGGIKYWKNCSNDQFTFLLQFNRFHFFLFVEHFSFSQASAFLSFHEFPYKTSFNVYYQDSFMQQNHLQLIQVYPCLSKTQMLPHYLQNLLSLLVFPNSQFLGFHSLYLSSYPDWYLHLFILK